MILPSFLGRNLDHHMTILALSACLFYIFSLAPRFGSDRFPIRDLGLTDIRVNIEFSHHSIDDDFQVKLPHARYDRLVRLRIDSDLKRRILQR